MNSEEIKLEDCTLPSDASSSLTGHSRTDATKQKEAGSRMVALGYHV